MKCEGDDTIHLQPFIKAGYNVNIKANEKYVTEQNVAVK